jgi:hypothetical protein
MIDIAPRGLVRNQPQRRDFFRGYRVGRNRCIPFRNENPRARLDFLENSSINGTDMRRINRAPWTPEDNERVKVLATGGASALRAAAALKCSVLSVRNQARKLGTPFPSRGETKKRLSAHVRSVG